MDKEVVALRWSAIGALFFGVLGIVFSYLTHSSAVLLDGFFSFVGFAMGLISIRVARLVRQPDDAKFQFGYAAFEPMFNAIKGLIILAVCGFACASAIGAILDGGREVVAGWGIVYAAIATVGCLAIALFQRVVARRTGSQLVEVDSRAWLVDGLMSVVVAAAFVGAWMLEGTQWSAGVPYVDPALVILLTVLMVVIPIRIVLEGAGELLGVAPEPEVQREVRLKVESVLDDDGLKKRAIRMVRIGREFWVLNHVLVPKDRRIGDVADLDEVRERIMEAVASVQPGMIVDTLFTARKEWIE
jgi:cation diffusion facilitator family transporter